ncbi:hypothetical protein ACRRTK_021593 [Alexandromys fortis]
MKRLCLLVLLKHCLVDSSPVTCLICRKPAQFCGSSLEPVIIQWLLFQHTGEERSPAKN